MAHNLIFAFVMDYDIETTVIGNPTKLPVMPGTAHTLSEQSYGPETCFSKKNKIRMQLDCYTQHQRISQ